MTHLKTYLTSLMLLISITTNAKVTAEQAARLGTELTPLGAIKSDDAASGIPKWQDVSEIDANEQPLFSITHSNYHQHVEPHRCRIIITASIMSTNKQT